MGIVSAYNVRLEVGVGSGVRIKDAELNMAPPPLSPGDRSEENRHSIAVYSDN